ncbi:hypothetical protein CWO91_16250 [Bradyrhizobium genosp. SA-3]|nr:hypothetical protein CWO91_16250 [Bradyrhizobium genosp. SA-3]
MDQDARALRTSASVLDEFLLTNTALPGVVIRSRYAEDALREATIKGISQYVLIGAGLDSFVLRSTWRQPRGRACLNWKVLGVNLLATARALPSHVSNAIFWASMTSPIGSAPIGMKHSPSRTRPLSSISHTFTDVPAWIRYRFPLSLPTTSK